MKITPPIVVLARMPKIKHFAFFIVFLVGSQSLYCQINTQLIYWGTEQAYDSILEGDSYDTTDTNFASAKALAFLKSLNADGDTASNLADGDWIELGFFDLDLTDDSTSSSINPNSSTTDLFQGVWTPLSSITLVGQDYDVAGDVGAGEFYFASKLSYNTGSSTNDYSVLHNEWADITIGSSNSRDILDGNTDPGTFSAGNLVDDRVSALYTQTFTNSNPVPLGIRFYDTNSKTTGTTRYNTIMNPNWTLDFSDNNPVELDLLELSGGSMQVNSGLVFEFDNTDANTANLSKVGTSQVFNNDFATTITYYDGTSGLTANSASHVLSGLDGSGAITIGGDHTLTIHANSGADRSFSGNIDASGSAGATTIVKTGAGKQILTGNLQTAGSSSGWLNISEGTLNLAGTTNSVEYLTGSGGTLELNSTIELGFANTTTSQSFDGNVTLSGSGDREIKLASGTAADDYKLEQNISGVISGSNKLVKTGVGRLVLEGDNDNTGGVDIDDGTLVIGNSSNDADAGSGTITINKGKLEVLSGDTVGNTIAGGSGKSMIGGEGTITSVTVGSAAGEVDAISAGFGHSSSTSSASSTQQVARNTSLDDAIGSFTITNLDLNDGGVFDWEISDFSGSAAGSDWDLLNVGALDFDPSSSKLIVNILPLASDGSMGASAGGMWADKTGTGGFKFLDVSSWANAPGTSQTMTSGFDINASAWLYHKNDPYGNWSVYYDTGTTAFYLQYSAVPEPSTYMMVTGLLMVPGMSYYRRLRKKKETSTERETSQL
jgi:autotransporter-associated beta strand protein